VSWSPALCVSRPARISRLRGQAAGGQKGPASATRGLVMLRPVGGLEGEAVCQRARHSGAGELPYVGGRGPEHQAAVILPLAPRVIGHCLLRRGRRGVDSGGCVVGLWVCLSGLASLGSHCSLGAGDLGRRSRSHQHPIDFLGAITGLTQRLRIPVRDSQRRGPAGWATVWRMGQQRRSSRATVGQTDQSPCHACPAAPQHVKRTIGEVRDGYMYCTSMGAACGRRDTL
jgi:hypothetical protein